MRLYLTIVSLLALVFSMPVEAELFLDKSFSDWRVIQHLDGELQGSAYVSKVEPSGSSLIPNSVKDEFFPELLVRECLPINPCQVSEKYEVAIVLSPSINSLSTIINPDKIEILIYRQRILSVTNLMSYSPAYKYSGYIGLEDSHEGLFLQYVDGYPVDDQFVNNLNNGQTILIKMKSSTGEDLIFSWSTEGSRLALTRMSELNKGIDVKVGGQP